MMPANLANIRTPGSFEPKPEHIDADGRPTEAYWFAKFDALEDHYRRRPFNDIVRMKLRADMVRLEAEAAHLEEFDAFHQAFAKWKLAQLAKAPAR